MPVPATTKKTIWAMLALTLLFAFVPAAAGQPSRLCQHILFCLYNQNAAQSSPDAIQSYSEDLIQLALPFVAQKSEVQILAHRLAQAELSARSGKGKMASEAEIAQAFNHLKQTVHAPASIRTDEAALHHFRQHALELKAFPSLFTAARNGTHCTPDEAVFLLYLLIEGQGKFYERDLDVLSELPSRGRLGRQGIHEQRFGGGQCRVPHRSLHPAPQPQNHCRALRTRGDFARILEFSQHDSLCPWSLAVPGPLVSP
jgi:hypothetical protein